MKAALIVMLALCTLCQAHIKMNSFNNVTATLTSRNKGVFSTTNTDGCGGNQAVGFNNYTEIWPGEPLELVWEMNGHPALPDFRIAFSSDGSLAKFEDDVLVDNIEHTGEGVYSHKLNAPRQLCTLCSIQVLHTGYDWAGCFDLKIVKAPCGGDCASTGVVENGKLDYKTGEVSCNSGYKKTSSNTCVSTGMNGAAAFFLSIFVILMFCIIVFAVLVALRRTGNLPEGVATHVQKGENLIGKGFTKIASLAKGSSSSSSSSNAAASPGATEAQTQQTQQPTPAPVASSGGFFKGMQCQAKYTGDGQFYRATIKDVNTHTNQYLVSYPEYGSEEWVPVTSLKK